MKNFLCKMKRIFVLLLIFPVMLICAACGSKDPEIPQTGGNDGGIVQPTPGTGGSGGGTGESSGGSEGGGTTPDNPSNPTPDDGGSTTPPVVEEQTFTVNLSYNLPTEIQSLLEDETKIAKVEEGYSLPTFEGTEFEDYFEGWYNKADDSKIETVSITAEKDATISIYATFNEENIKNYFYSSGLEFEYDTTGDYYTATPKTYTGTSQFVVIPQIVKVGQDNYFVETIGNNCFKGKNITKVHTYLTDFSVGTSAFEGSELNSIDFSKIKIVGNSAFKNTKITEAKFSATLQSVGSSAFYGCTELEKVDFSTATYANLSYIPDYLFYNCEKLSEFKSIASISAVNSYAFYGCKLLPNIDFVVTNNVTSIQNYAFANCVTLDNIILPNSLVSYGTNIFAGCNIKNLTLYRIFYKSFNDTNNLTTYMGNLSASLEKLTILGNNAQTIYSNYFAGYSKLTDFIMCNSITKVENNAFYACSNLENITFSTSLSGENINISAFKDTKWYSGLDETLANEQKDSLVMNNSLLYISSEYANENYLVQDGVTYIDANVFTGRESIKSVEIPASVVLINRKAFANSSITSVSVDNANENYKAVSGTLDSFDQSGAVTGTISYSSLFILSGSETTELVAYFANKNGGFYVVDSSVVTINDIAFICNNTPSYVYAKAQNAKLVFTENVKTTTYILENSSLDYARGSNSYAVVYEYLPQEADGTIYYTIEGENIVLTANEDVLSTMPKYFIIIAEIDEGGSEPVTKYYLYNNYNVTVKEISEIYNNFQA